MNREILDLAATHASRDETRLMLLPVRVEAHRVWATDGHRAVVLRVDSPPEFCGDYIDGEKVDNVSKAPPIDRVLPKDCGKTRVRLDSPIINCLRFLAESTSKKWELIARFENGVCEIRAKKPEGEKTRKRREKQGGPEPKWAVQIPGIVVNRPLELNLHYLLDAIDAVGPSGFTLDLCQGPHELDPVRIDGGRGFAIIMPRRF